MRINRYIVWFLTLMLVACGKVEDIEVPTTSCAPLPVGLASACATSLDGKGYVFGGRDQAGTYLNDLWQYDPQGDTWNNMGGTPLKARVNAAVAAYGGQLYVGLGFAKGRIYDPENYIHDWWRWDPKTNIWTRLADYPYQSTNAATLYVVGDRIYVIYGASDCFSRNIHYYEPKTDRWFSTEDSHFRALSAFCGVGATIHDKTYYGLGNNTTNLTQWYTMDLPTDTWTKRKSLPGKGRVFSAAATGTEHIYIFGGRYFGGDKTGGEVFADIWRYNPDADSWARCGLMPNGRAENMIAFSINGKIYFGLGEDENATIKNTLYRIED